MTVGSVSPARHYAAGEPGANSASATYTVQRGDTLTRIARQHGVSLADLIAANPQIANPNLIYPDQQINIPGRGGGHGNGGANDAAPVEVPSGGYDGGPLSGPELAQVFYQAGFRGENLVAMVAIATRESGGDPDAFNGNAGTGDKSYGLTQINMLGSLGPARLQQLGLMSNEQLFDPLTNARAAYVISNNGTDLRPWGGYKGLSNTFNTDMNAARAAVQQAEAQGLLGKPFNGNAGTYQTVAYTPAASTRATQAWNAAPQMPTLRIGARGPAVAELQRQLKAAGFNPGPVDGWFGPKTQAAVRAFQASRGITVDGWVGPQTWGKLLGGRSGPAPAKPAAPTSPGGAPSSGIQAAIDFGMSHIGAPYVGGGSPFRFGDPGNGKTYQMNGQRAYVSPAGVTGFDCSGFVVAMYEQAGIDLKAQGITYTGAMESRLPAISPNELRPGDLIVNGGSHVVMYIGDGKVIESTARKGPDGQPLGVTVSDASRFLGNPEYVCRRVPMA